IARRLFLGPIRPRIRPGIRLRRRRRTGRIRLAQAELGRTRRPCTPTLRVEHLLGDRDLLTARCLIGSRGVLAATERGPGAGGELQAAVVAVAGVDRPVTAGLALCEL